MNISFVPSLTRALVRVGVLLAALACYGLFASVAHAQAPVIVLTINGGSTVAIVNGQSITLEWYISGNVSNCSINNGVGAIDISGLPTPVTGLLVTTPPNNSSTNYTLNCDGFSDTVTSTLKPLVNISIDGGNSKTVSAVTGAVTPTVRWNTQFATRCELLKFYFESSPTTIRTAGTAQRYSGAYQPTGSVDFDGWPQQTIRETTTYFITCHNDVNGTSQTATTTLTVLVPPPPSPVAVEMWADSYTVSPNPLFGYATANVHTRSWNRTNCNYSAFYRDSGLPYSNPPGWGQWGGHANGDFSVRLATSTIFEFQCSRPSVTLGTTTYPSEATSTRITVNLSSDPMLVDRSVLPPVTVTLIPVPATATSTILNAVTNRGTMSFDILSQNADYCYLRAYDASNANQYNLSGWTRTASHNRISGNMSSPLRITTSDLSITTDFNVECIRAFDRNNYELGTIEHTNGYATATVRIAAVPSDTPAPDPTVYIYANPVSVSSATMLSTATENVGFSSQNYNVGSVLPFLRAAVTPSTNNRLTFPFYHPDGEDGVYNVHFSHCDEADGVSTYRFYTADDGLIGTHVTDKHESSSTDCNSGTYKTNIVAQNVSIDDGELVTVECDTAVTTEPCRLESMLFGQGNGSSVIVEPDPLLNFASVNIVWRSENTTYCDNQTAFPISGPSYTYAFTSARNYSLITDVATTTSFKVSCGRAFDSVSSISEVEVIFPSMGPIVSSVGVSSGVCIDPGTGLSGPAPDGYRANPVTGFCEPSVDLRAMNPSMSIGTAVTDNVNGTYNDLDSLLLIENLGIGEVPNGTPLSYLARLTFMPVYSLPDISSAVGSYTGGLIAPLFDGGGNLIAPTESPTLTRTFDDIPFGTHTLCSRVNLDGSPDFPESNPDTSNNTGCSSITLPVPPPPMTLTVDRAIIRTEQTITLDWDINVSYNMACIVQGAGGVNESFNTPGGLMSGSVTTSPITSTSKFTFSCTEPITNTTFVEEVTVEVVPDYQEI